MQDSFHFTQISAISMCDRATKTRYSGHNRDFLVSLESTDPRKSPSHRDMCQQGQEPDV